YAYRRPLGKAVFNWLQRRVAGFETEGMTVTVDHDVHEVRIVEGSCGPLEGGFIELPAGRPLSPQQPTQVVAMLGKTLAPSFGLKKMLIPADALERRSGSMSLLAHLDDVVACIGYEGPDSLRPHRRRHAGRVAAPIEPSEDRPLQAESLGNLDDVAAAGSLLSAAHYGIEHEARRSEPARIGGNDPGSGVGQNRGHFIEGMNVIGETVRQDHGPTLRRPVLDIGDPQGRGVNALYRSAACPGYGDFRHQRRSPDTAAMKARRSASKSPGSSRAAKWPPLGMSVQCTML